MSGPFGESVTIHSRGKTGVDGDNNDVFGDTDTTYTNVTLYPRDSTEVTQGGDLNSIGLVAVFLYAVAILPTDEATARGKRWQVDGAASSYHSSLTGGEVTQVYLKREEG